jgi:Domain of unknown function (DUF4293)
MIQRIQTLWLLLASAGAFLSLKLPFYSGTTKDGVASHQLNGTDNYLLMFSTILIGLLALIIIFLFKNRRLQLRLCVLGIIMTIGLIALYYIESMSYLAGTGTYALSALLQGLVIFFFFFAIKGISKDIKVIKDSNRLR